MMLTTFVSRIIIPTFPLLMFGSTFLFSAGCTKVNQEYEEAIGYYKEQNFEKAVVLFSRAASDGHVKSQFSLGECYRLGKGVNSNIDVAIAWYRRAAEHDCAEAENALGEYYMSLNNLSDAIYWWTKSAEHGYAQAQWTLGYYFSEVANEPRIAFKWLLQAAEQENPDAENLLGNIYFLGKGVEINYNEGLKWYRKAAEHGNVYALFNLGDSYEYGKGVQADKSEAIKWYRMALEQNYSMARQALWRLGYSPL